MQFYTWNLKIEKCFKEDGQALLMHKLLYSLEGGPVFGAFRSALFDEVPQKVRSAGRCHGWLIQRQAHVDAALAELKRKEGDDPEAMLELCAAAKSDDLWQFGVGIVGTPPNSKRDTRMLLL